MFSMINATTAAAGETTGTTATTAANVAETVGKTLEVTWQGMLAICVVIAICITVTVIMSRIDRAAAAKKNQKAEDDQAQQ